MRQPLLMHALTDEEPCRFGAQTTRYRRPDLFGAVKV